MRIVKLGLILVLVSSSISSGSPTDVTGSDYVIIRRLVPNDLHNKKFPKDELEQIIATSPPRNLTIEPGQTVSGLLQKNYNISKSWTPAVYDSVIQKINELNPDLDLNRVPAGKQVLMPHMPVTSKSNPGENPFNATPKMAVGLPGKQYSWEKNASFFTGNLYREDTNRPASQMEWQVLRVPDSAARQYARLDDDDNPYSWFAYNSTIKVHLAEIKGGPDSTEPVLTNEQRRYIKTYLAKAPDNPIKPVLVILDDSFPDNESFHVAVNFVLTASDAIRRTYGLGDSPNTEALRSLELSTSFLGASPYPGYSLHSAIIHHALDEFTSLDDQHLVKVVYLPLSASQTGAKQLLREIIYLGQLVTYAAPAIAEGVTPEKSILDQAVTDTDTIIKDNKALTWAPLQPVSGTELDIATDVAVIQSLSIVLHYFSEATRQPFVLSFSWTVPDLSLRPYFEQGSYGWKLVAAGNGTDNKVANVHNRNHKIQFAYRSLAPRDFVVVGNASGDKVLCNSNTFEDAPNIKVMGLAFPGNVTSKLCGTSFSTPRIAWLLAAREAVSGTHIAIGDSEAMNAWVGQQEDLILGVQNPKAKFPGKYSVTPDKLLNWPK